MKFSTWLICWICWSKKIAYVERLQSPRTRSWEVSRFARLPRHSPCFQV
ncbi:hypothetical protein PspLS_00685 [Pyricularia sp. CBS 133598]|nr:hypothetical protein PspLS_00685 [Pyricularia sp. CBS 133598]